MGQQKLPLHSLIITEKDNTHATQLTQAQQMTIQLQNELIDMSRDAILVYDPQGRILSWNHGAEQLYGWKENEAIGRTVDEILCNNFAYMPSDIKHILEQQGRWEGEIIYMHQDGKQVIVESHQSLLRDTNGYPAAILEVDQDVTHHRQTEQALQEQIQLALAAQEIGLWVRDLKNNRSILMSSHMYGLFDAPPGTAFASEQILNTIHPDDRERADLTSKEAIREHKEYNIEYRVVWPDQSIHWLAVRGLPLHDKTGQPTQIVGISIDITERKLNEEILTEANRKITAILESITDGFFQLDADWHIIYANKQAENITHKTRQEMSGKRIWDIIPDLVGTTFEEKASHAMNTKTRIQFEALHEVSKRWFSISAYPADSGMMVYCNDITKYKNTEIALRESEAKFRSILNSNIIGITVIDATGNILEANNTFLSMLGYTSNEFVPQQLNWYAMTPAEYAPLDQQADNELRTKGFFKPFEKEFINKSNKRTPVLVTGVRFNPANACIALVMDMVPQKQLERQKETFMSIVGHELRTPLTAINGNIQLAQRRLQKFLKKRHEPLDMETQLILDKLAKQLEQSLRQTRVQNRLINDLLDISRLAVDKLELAIQPCDLVNIVRETVEDLRYTEADHEIELTIPEQEYITVQADPDRIGQVVANYITNALKYSPPDAPVKVEIVPDQHEVRVWVRDEGPGLSPEAQKHIWDRFYRATGIKDRKKNGVNLGLGLYICQVLIKRHHGEVGVESTEGKGSSFWFSLPLNCTS